MSFALAASAASDELCVFAVVLGDARVSAGAATAAEGEPRGIARCSLTKGPEVAAGATAVGPGDAVVEGSGAWGCDGASLRF